MFSEHPLVTAAEEGDLAAVQRMVSAGADVNSRGIFEVTPLMAAVKEGHVDIVRFLLDQPATSVDALNAGGTTALMIAARLGKLDMVKILLADPRTDPNQEGKWGGTALINAAGFGQVEIVKELLKIENISLAETYTDKKHSPMSIARQNDQPEALALLEAFIARRDGQKPASPKNGAPKP